MSDKLLKGRYTATDGDNTHLVGEVRYLNPLTGELYEDADRKIYANIGFKPGSRTGVWVDGDGFEFTIDEVAVESAKAILGYVVASARGAPTVLHRTQKIAEAEALRLARGNTGFEFTVFPVYCGEAVAKAHTPKPVAKLEKL